MVRYLGQRGDVHVVAVSPAGDTTLSCQVPCEFVKLETRVAGRVLHKETTRAVEGSLGWAIMADAMNGELKPYRARKQ